MSEQTTPLAPETRAAVAELVTVTEDGETETATGYLVTALTVTSAYDPEADQ